eukprot:COSAG01_NODE_12252_length_1773_cov_1.633214_3_plen_155_part_00
MLDRAVLHPAQWVITSSPLILGMWPSDAELAPFLDVLGNAEAIEINQQWAGHPGRMCREEPLPGSAPLDKIQVWSKPLPGAAMAVFVLNYAAVASNYTLVRADLDFNGTAFDGVASIRDVWRRTNNGTVATGGMAFSIPIPAYDSVLLRLSPVQ